MFVCPKCRVPLAKAKADPGVFWVCPSCQGRAVGVGLLRKNIPAPLVNLLWQRAQAGRYPRLRNCPACNGRAIEVPVPGERGSERLDVCLRCEFVWFDPKEYEVLPTIPKALSYEETLPQAAREKLALIEIEEIRKRAEESDHGRDAPYETWKWIPAVLGMPVEYEANALIRMPWLTWLIALAIAAVSVAAFFNLKEVVQSFGLIPAQLWRYGGLTWLTAFFLHGGAMHLIGNLYFFLIFGDNVEDCLGRWRFLLLLMLASLVGDIGHILGNPASATPCIGASGGISGVIAYYALRFPKAKLSFLLRFGSLLRWVGMPAWTAFLIWLILQFFGARQQMAGFSNVSSLAHLGGVAVGFIFWLATRKE